MTIMDTRRRIEVTLVPGQRYLASEVAERTGLTVSTVSRHFKSMAESGKLWATEDHRHQTYYTLPTAEQRAERRAERRQAERIVEGLTERGLRPGMVLHNSSGPLFEVHDDRVVLTPEAAEQLIADGVAEEVLQ